jgi:hypothetical protein
MSNGVRSPRQDGSTFVVQGHTSKGQPRGGVWRESPPAQARGLGIPPLVALFLSVAIACVLFGSAAAYANEIKANCAKATETQVECMSLTVTGTISAGYPGTGEKEGLSPENLRSAYKLPSAGGSGQTVAIVDAYNDPNAESDLAKYREKYSLGACTEANGCFKKVNQNGEKGSYPVGEPGWSVEISLDLDMVSAICSECHITLVEATSNSFANMDAAENEAASLTGTTVISDSWGAPETVNRTSEDTYFNHPGIPIAVSAGDRCYLNECGGYKAPNWPSTSPYVISVGGILLEKATSSRGWKESVWYEPASEFGPIGTGSGCAVYESKPSWESDASCSHRTDTDVSAVAACSSPLSLYDSYEKSGWINECGTSAAAPIIAGVEALSSKEFREDGAQAFWQIGSVGRLFDTTEGHNYYTTGGNCGTYLCNGGTGFDGPTGWGTPNGVFSGWLIQPTVNPTEYSSLSGVSCASATHCVAVGRTENVSGATLAEAWNGTSWSRQTTPNPEGETGFVRLSDVSCTSTESCEAVGSYKGGHGLTSFGEHWNGTSWSLQTTPKLEPEESALMKISCSSASACTAVGYRLNGSVAPLVERWNGTSWSVQSVPVPPTAEASELKGISCVSSTMCVAVGYYRYEESEEDLIESWNGEKWTIDSAPTGSGWLVNISCSSTTECTAVGYEAASPPIAERWKGTTWSIESLPEPVGSQREYDSVNSVMCVSSTRCTTVGAYAPTVETRLPDAATWNGSHWELQSVPNPGGTLTRLSGISCTALTACTAVGSSTPIPKVAKSATLAERFSE